MGWSYGNRVHSDASAAIGIARRRGMREMRHLDVTDLWVQEKVKSMAVNLVKIKGENNPADIFTKYVDRSILTKNARFHEPREARQQSEKRSKS